MSALAEPLAHLRPLFQDDAGERGEDHRPLDGVAELPDIARPLVAFQGIHGGRGKSRQILVTPGRLGFQTFFGQEYDVVFSLP